MGTLTRALALLTLSASAALAQVTEQTTVEVIQVPVYVTSSGAPIPNLTRDNFRLFVNGKPQSIDYFDAIDFQRLSPEDARDPRQRRLYLLVFDVGFSSANSLQRAQKAAEKIIESARDTDTFGIAAMAPSRGVEVVVPFSRDRIALVRAIRNLQPSRVHDPLRLALTPSEREGIASGTMIGGSMIGTLVNAEDNGARDFEGEIVRERIESAIGDLADTAVRLAPLEGIKHVVLLSAGFDASLIHGVTSQRSAYGASKSRDRESAANLAFSPRLLGALRRMHDTFKTSGVFLDAIDIAGLRMMQSTADNEALYILTRDTGGEVVDKRNDLAGAMQYLVDSQRVAYVLAFNAPKTGRTLNKIAVKVVDVPRFAHASYRESYASQTDPPDAGDPLRLADIVMNDIPQTGVTMTALAEPDPGQATVGLEIAGGELVAQAAGMTVEGEVLLYVFAGSGAVAFDRKQITIEPRAAAALATRPLRVSHTFDLPPGKYVAKALVRFGFNGSLGFARTEEFTVPTASP
ncbi:MAG: VWA domain-containing protein [Acidobacteriota bacterium]|nr:VWA domain-containing protein [Acidobacteriota bacterium]